ncbi:MAG: cytochrome c maturation protein CcmE [Alphaproteobacteria bacterium]|nr:cytochrome c maturation protein CcmE [Alphaproteobacteria bacterium]
MKPKHQRLVFVLASVLFLCAAVLLVMQAFKQNLVYFYSPSDIAGNPPAPTQKIRIGGLVKTGSIAQADDRVRFTVTDQQHEIEVRYQGVLPALFREGQGVIAEGVMDGAHFSASTILAKHDEKYMPKEVVDALKKSGHWEGQYAR